MKRKAFGLLGVFLVMFQMFSPWMVNIDQSRLTLDKNLASAQDSKETINGKDVYFDGNFYYNDTKIKKNFYRYFDSKKTRLTNITPYIDSQTQKLWFKVEFSISFFDPEKDDDADPFVDREGIYKGVADNQDDYGWWDLLVATCYTVKDNSLIMKNGCLMSSYNINNKLKDLRATEEGSFDTEDFIGVILDISDDQKFPKDKTNSYSLNPSIFGGTTPETSSNSLMFQQKSIGGSKIYPINSEDVNLSKVSFTEGGTYYARMRIDFSNDTRYIGHLAFKEILFNYSNPTEQTVREENISVVKEGGDQVDFLPKCGIPGLSSGSLTGCLIQIFYWLVFDPTARLLSVAGGVLDFILGYSIKPDAYKAQYIVDSWRFIRDVCNLFFIFMLIYLAFKMMLGIGQDVKKSIVNTLIIAAVINFSYPLTTIVIDASNITARQLYYNAFSRQGDDGKPLSLSAAAAKGYNPQTIILDGLQKNGGDPNENKSTIFMILLMGVIFNVIAILMFLKLALQFVYRTIGLIFAIILSPIAVFSFSLSKEQRSKLKLAGFDEWMNGLLSDAFKAPVFLFLVMVLILFVNNNPFQAAFGDDLSTAEWWASLIIPFMIVVAFFKVITSITKSMTSSIAQMAGDAVVKGVGAIAGVAMGGAALAGSGIIGKGMGKLAESKMGQRIMDRSVNNKGLSGWIAQKQVKAMRAMQGGSYDIRQTGVMNAVSKESGANFNMGTNIIDKGLGAVGFGAYGLSTGMRAGGYMAQGDRKNKEREEFLKLVQHDKVLENKLKDKKDIIEDKKEETEKEIQRLKDEHKAKKDPLDNRLRNEKANLREKESELKNKEKNKTDTDEAVKAIQELEDLLAKKLDIIATTPAGQTPATAEIDNKITRMQDKVIANAGAATGAALTGAIAAGGGQLNQAMLSGVKTEALTKKTTAKSEFDTAKINLETAKNTVNQIEDEIKNLTNQLTTELVTPEQNLKNYNNYLKEIDKAIENVRNGRSNALAHKVRNKSGRIYKKETYRTDKNGAGRDYTTEQAHAFSAASGGEDLTNEMENIITNIEERSKERRSWPIRGVNHIIFNGQTNETYRSSRNADNYRPDTQDTYTPPRNKRK